MSRSRSNDNKDNKNDSTGIGRWIGLGLVGGGLYTLVEALIKPEPGRNDTTKSNLRPK